MKARHSSTAASPLSCADRGEKGLGAHTDAQLPLRQQQAPLVVGDDGHRFPHRPQHLGQGIADGQRPRPLQSDGPDSN